MNDALLPNGTPPQPQPPPVGTPPPGTNGTAQPPVAASAAPAAPPVAPPPPQDDEAALRIENDLIARELAALQTTGRPADPPAPQPPQMTEADWRARVAALEAQVYRQPQPSPYPPPPAIPRAPAPQQESWDDGTGGQQPAQQGNEYARQLAARLEQLTADQRRTNAALGQMEIDRMVALETADLPAPLRQAVARAAWQDVMDGKAPTQASIRASAQDFRSAVDEGVAQKRRLELLARQADVNARLQKTHMNPGGGIAPQDTMHGTQPAPSFGKDPNAAWQKYSQLVQATRGGGIPRGS